MLRKTFALTVMVSLFAFVSTATVPAAKDSIKGEWIGVFAIAGQTASVTMKFDVQGSKVTGTVFSQHTGAGTVMDGKWKHGKLTCTLKFEKHESMAFSGWFKNGKFLGEFKTEGMTGTWTAMRK